MDQNTNTNKTPWVTALLVFGVSALLISFWIQSRSQKERENLVRIGQVERNFGQIFTFRPGTEKKKKVSQLEFLSPLDSVETEEQSEARIALDNEGVLRVLPDSLVTFERIESKDGYQDIVIVQRGDIHVDDAGREGELFVSKNGQRVAAKQYHQSSLSHQPVDRAQSERTRSDTRNGLAEDEISSLVGAQRGNFMKCYTNLLQRDPEAKGELSLNFTIENSGKVGVIEVNSPRLKNEDFRKCLSNVLARVQFRSFTGAAISTFFPLKFE